MTNELEKQFFDTFGIEPYDRYIICDNEGYCDSDMPCDCCIKGEEVYCYPEITDRILLELMALLMKQEYTEFYYHDDEYLFSSKLLGSNRPTCNRVNNLRELILRTATCLGGFTPLKNEMLHQVQALFKE